MTTATPTAPPSRAAAGVTEHRFRTADGAELFYRAWLPERPTTKALILFHRGHEHSGRWRETVEALGLEDVAVFAWDQRGHGLSSGERGSAPGLAAVVRDADEWSRHLAAEFGVRLEDAVVVGHSLGAVVASAWVHDYAPPVRGLVLATPAFRIKLYVPFALPLLRLRESVFGPGQVKSFLTPGMLTRDPEQAEAYRRDPLIFPQIAVNMLLDVAGTADRLLDDAAAFTCPLLVLAAGNDWVVENGPQRRFVERVSSPVKEFEVLSGYSHAVFHDRGRDVVVDKVRRFALDCFADAPSPPPPVTHTHDEFGRLSRPGGFHYAPVRWFLKSVGRLSRGIGVGWRHGFDSGVMLDYIYENRARGLTPLGRLIDRLFLDAPGWRGIRARRVMLESALRSVVEQAHAEGGPVHVLDIAAGPGRYVLETIARTGLPVSAELRDYKPENLAAAAALRDGLGLQDITVAHGDAFDRDALASADPRPSVAVVSGLYELEPDNEAVLRSLRGIADAAEPGAWLVYTNQPWHPQIEFIARVLINREGRPWVMRRRPQAEMDALVRAAGFEKVSQEVDPCGMFTVSVARLAGR